MSVATRPGRWPLVALTVAVLLVHLGLLGRSGWMSISGDAQPLRVQAMSTRTIPVPAPDVLPLEVARAPSVPPARVGPTPRPRAAPLPVLPLHPAVNGATASIVEPVVEAPAAHDVSEPDQAEGPPPSVAPAASDPATAAASAAVDPVAGESSSGVVLSARVAPPARLRYEVVGQVRRLTYSAGAELLWRHDGHRYDARLEVSAFLVGSRTQTSTGDITPEGLAPRRFSDKARSEVAAHFDWANQRVSFSANTPSQPLLPGAQDRLSLSLQLGALLAARPTRLQPGDSLTLQIVGPRDAEPWVFTAENEERLTLPFGELVTRKFVRLPRREHDARLELWLAPALDFLPVRVRLTQSNGDFVEQLLRAREALDIPAPSAPQDVPAENAN